MSDYNLVSTGEATWLTPDELTTALADAFPDTEIKQDLVPGAPVTVWAYVPDGEHHTAEFTFDETGRMLAFTDASPDLAARIAVLLARRPARPPSSRTGRRPSTVALGARPDPGHPRHRRGRPTGPIRAPLTCNTQRLFKGHHEPHGGSPTGRTATTPSLPEPQHHPLVRPFPSRSST
jgi:hypothetical protein